jgi:Zn-finger nucleic acid-binding protein
VQCSACGLPIDASGVFPGAKLACSCGVENVVPLPPHPSPAGEGGPGLYRVPAERSSEAAILTCPFCGGPCGAEVRACPHCNVELASVRCPHCYALHFVGAQFCARCGKELALEPLLDATDAPCPRCNNPLSIAKGGAPEDFAGTAMIHECVACGGIFVDNTSLEHILARERDPTQRHIHEAHAATPAQAHAADPVRYLKCPLCRTSMNRVNFGKRSGVIVDVCKQHGTWFDSGELTSAIEFVAKGGIEETKRRDEEERKAAAPEVARAAAEMRAEMVREAVDEGRGIGRWEGRWGGDRHSTLLDILFELLR